MRIALIADTYPPLRSSGAIQLRDLSIEFAKQGHSITVLVASPGLDVDWMYETQSGVQVLRLKSPEIKDIGYVRRTLAEFFMPYVMKRGFFRSPLVNERWDGVIWYSPSIFLGPFAKVLMDASECKGYLIIRDIFPEWAADMRLMSKGLPYYIFKLIARKQYLTANIIGVQTLGNVKYFKNIFKRKPKNRVEVLQNWLEKSPDAGCSIQIANTKLAGRDIFVYAGNMGVAQGMDIIIDVAESLMNRKDIGFLFVGRGSDVQRLRLDVLQRGMDNVIFYDEIDPKEIPGLYAQCQVGLVALDRRHKTHNIPGKFLSYMAHGLPVLASINYGNDLVELIEKEQTGLVCTDSSVLTLSAAANKLIVNIRTDEGIKLRCEKLAQKLFSTEKAVNQIVYALK